MYSHPGPAGGGRHKPFTGNLRNLAPDVRISTRIRSIRRWARRNRRKRDTFQRIRKIRRWRDHGRKSSEFSRNPKNSKIGGGRRQKTRYIPKNSKNSKMEAPWQAIFAVAAPWPRFGIQLRRFAAMVPPSSNFSNSLECIAFSAPAVYHLGNLGMSGEI